MRERDRAAALIERLISDSRLPPGRERDELRRELTSHFEDAGDAPQDVSAAIARFGSPDVVGAALRRAHRPGRRALYAAKILAAIVASAFLALLLQLALFAGLSVANRQPHFGLPFVIGVCCSAAIIVSLVVAWELDFEPLRARLEREPGRLLLTMGAWFAAINLAHGGGIEPVKAFVGSCMTVAVWTCTVAIQAWLEKRYLGRFGP